MYSCSGLRFSISANQVRLGGRRIKTQLCMPSAREAFSYCIPGIESAGYTCAGVEFEVASTGRFLVHYASPWGHCFSHFVVFAIKFVLHESTPWLSFELDPGAEFHLPARIAVSSAVTVLDE